MYFVIFLILVFFALSELTGQFKNKREFSLIGYLFILSLFIIFMGFRYRIGGDTINYMNSFDQMPEFKDFSSFDFLTSEYNISWYIFVALCKLVSIDFLFFQFTHVAILNIGIFYFINKHCYKYQFSCVLLYYLTYYLYLNTEILRESLAMVFFLFGYDYLLKKKFIKYYLLVLLSISIHTSAIILLIIPFFQVKMKFPFYASLFIAIIVFFIGVDAYTFFSKFSFSTQIAQKMNSYLNAGKSVTGLLVQLILIFPTIYLKFLKDKIYRNTVPVKKDKFDCYIPTFILIGALASVISGFYRFLNYFSIINIVFIINTLVLVLSSEKIRLNSKILARFSVIMLLFYQGYYYSRKNSEYDNLGKYYNRYFPYTNYYSKEKNEIREKMMLNYNIEKYEQ